MADFTLKDEQGNTYKFVEMWLDYMYETGAGAMPGKRKVLCLERVTDLVAQDPDNTESVDKIRPQKETQ